MRNLASRGREAERVALRLTPRFRGRWDSEAHSPRIPVHDSEDVSAADSSRGDHEGSRRGREASQLPKILVDLQEDVAPRSVGPVEARLASRPRREPSWSP